MSERPAEKLVEALVNKYGSVSNKELAFQQVSQIDGVTVEEGEIEEVSEVEAFNRFASSLEDKIGPVGVRFARQALQEVSVPEKVTEKIADKYAR